MPDLPAFQVDMSIGPFTTRLRSSKIQNLLKFFSVFAKSDTSSKAASPPKSQIEGATKTKSPLGVQRAEHNPSPAKPDITDEKDLSVAARSRHFVAKHERKKFGIHDVHIASTPVFMRVKFRFEKIQFSVSDDSDAQNPQVLVKVVMENLLSRVHQRNFDTTVDVSLESFDVFDSLSSTADVPQYILTSRSLPVVPDDQKLVALRINTYQPLSEHYEKAAADIVCSCKLSSMSFVFQPKTVARLMRFVATTFPQNAETTTDVTLTTNKLHTRAHEAKTESPSPRDTVLDANKMSEPSRDQHNPYYSQHASMLLNLTASGFCFEFRNPENQHPVAKASMSNVSIDAIQRHSMASVRASSSLIVEDCTADTAVESKILSYQSESGTAPLTLKLDKFDREARTYPGYDLAVAGMISNLHVFVREDFMRLCQKCLTPVVDQMNALEQHQLVRDARQELQRQTSKAAETAIAAVSSPPLIHLRAQNLNLDIRLANQSSICAQLSSLTIANGNTAGSAHERNTTHSAPGRDVFHTNELATTSQTKTSLQTIAINVVDLVCRICVLLAVFELLAGVFPFVMSFCFVLMLICSNSKTLWL